MTSARSTALAASLAALFGLAVAASLSNTANAAPGVEVHTFVNDSCIIADEPFYVPESPGSGENAKFIPIIAAIVGQLTSLFIHHEADVAAGKMKAQAARKDTRYAMVRQMNLYRADLLPEPVLRLNANLGCMTIVAGALEPESTDCKAAYVPRTVAPGTLKLPQEQWRTSRTDDSVENQLRRANVCAKGKVEAVYEARFEFSADGTAYRLKDAGYHIESLLTTQKKGASRAVIYTLQISDPSSTDQAEVLSTAWVNLGTVSAGAHSSGAAGNSAPWLRVPPLTPEARRSYEERTKVHQEVTGEIDALKRALKLDQRMLASLDQRIAASSSDVAEGLKQERTRIAVQYQTQSAELDARTAEYQDLPHAPLELMPVTIEVAVTESESEKKSQLALADLIGAHADIVTTAVGTATTGMLSRAVNFSDESPPSGAASPAGLDPLPGRGFTLVTEEEYRRLKEQASKLSPESAPPEARALDIDAPRIVVDAPKPGIEQHSPWRLALRFEHAADAKIDLSTFQVIYKLGPLRMDITDRIRPFVTLTEAGVSGSSSTAIPAGTHTVIVRIRDTHKRLGEQTITIRVAAA